MAFVHGKNAVVKLNAADLSAFTNKVDYKRKVDSHDTTTFGQAGHTYAPGLTDGTVSLHGTFDDGTSPSPDAVIRGLLGGSNVAFIYQPEGTGVGKSQNVCQVQVTSYNTSAPVADMVSWDAELQISGNVTITDQ